MLEAEVLVLVSTPAVGASLPIFVEVVEYVPGWWTVRMRGATEAVTEGRTSREHAISAAMGFR